MYIVRWLMGHPIIATWVLGAIAILLTLGSGTKEREGEDQPPSMHSSSLEAQDLPAAKTDKKDHGKAMAVKVDDDSDALKPLGDTTTSSDTEKKSMTASIRSIKSTTSVAVVNDNDEPSTGKENIEETSVSNTEQFNVPVVGQAAQEDVGDLGQSSTEEMLQMAREAYWNNGLDEAAQIYKQLIKLEPMVIEHKGELGNVYWRQGYPKKAAELYSEIAVPMIESGGSDRVANMIGFIGLFYPDRAAKIHVLIQSKEKDVQEK